MPITLFKKLFFQFDKKHKLYFVFIFFIFLLQMFLELFSITLFIPLISFILDTNINENKFYIFFKENLGIDLIFILGDLKVFLIFFVVVFFTKILLTIFCNWHKIGFVYKVRKFLTNRIYHKYLNLPYENFISKNSSVYLKNINHEINIASEGFLQLLEFTSELIVIFGLGLFLFLYNFEVTSIIFVISIISIILINFLKKKKITKLGAKVNLLEQLRLKNYIESFNLIKEIKIFGNENFFKKKNYKLTSDFLHNDFLFRFLKSIPRILFEFALIVIFIIIIMINLKYNDNILILEILGVFAASAYRLMPSAVRILGSLQVTKYALPSLENIVEEVSLVKLDKYQNRSFNEIKTFEREISFENVGFKYKNSEKYILKKINLSIPSKKIIGIKGKTGSGKTTIINLLAGLIDPTEGSILIDKINYKDLNVKSLQKLISYVPQNIFLMDDTIKNNILFGSENYSEQDLEQAILKSNLEKFVKDSFKGLETTIGEKSSKISGGQSQRIGIARALIKKPSILILDESTNSLDNETENQIFESIRKLQNELTIILISHSNNSLKICDKIIDLDEV